MVAFLVDADICGDLTLQTFELYLTRFWGRLMHLVWFAYRSPMLYYIISVIFEANHCIVQYNIIQ
jgi:hypothetical protein